MLLRPRIGFHSICVFFSLFVLLPCGFGSRLENPNFVVILADDLGYSDLGIYGARGFETPRLDKMAAEGMRFNSFYMPSAVCSPSRAALLTGCHPKRLGLGHRVLFPFSKKGLHPNEQTIAELLKPAGYRSICIGKWHLGHDTKFMPLRQGFDEYFGVPYSNDMDGYYYRRLDFRAPPLPLFQNNRLIESGPDQSTLTGRFTDRAIRFIEQNNARPFFLYLAHVMPHQPIHASKDFRGQTELGLYGDVIAEIDHNVGRILDALQQAGIDDRTLVVFTSDNGPWRAASAGPLRGKKNSTWEGGHRVPCIMRCPSLIPPGSQSNHIVSAMDLLPTIAELSGCQPAGGRVLDGNSLRPVLIDPASSLSNNHFYFYRDNRLQAVRKGNWKLHVYRPEWEPNQQPPMLFDLQNDLGESTDVAASYPGVVAELQQLATQARQELGDDVTGAKGQSMRQAGTVD